MANIETNQTEIKATRSHRTISLRIDMTPMVDLGFLLITFFIFTATLNEPRTFSLYMPKGDEGSTLVPESGALNIIIDKQGRLYYYEGKPTDNRTAYKTASLTTIRKVIIDKKMDVISKYRQDADCEARAVANHADPGDCRQKDLMVLIKPAKDADYKNIVGVLDEMTINKIARYAIVDPEKEDLDFIGSRSE
ncbi:MAG: biopolymer transporter ExbD [Niabella sp.]